MKKSSELRIVRIFKSIFNVRTWSDYDRIKSFTTYLVNGFKKLFIPQKKAAGSGDTFKKAMKDYNLSEDDLIIQQNALWRWSILMVVITLCIFSYSVYSIFNGSIKAFIVSFVVSLISLTLAFRYHFWYYQIKVRKLGCSVREWYRQGLLGEKK